MLAPNMKTESAPEASHHRFARISSSPSSSASSALRKRKKHTSDDICEVYSEG